MVVDRSERRTAKVNVLRKSRKKRTALVKLEDWEKAIAGVVNGVCGFERQQGLHGFSPKPDGG